MVGPLPSTQKQLVPAWVLLGCFLGASWSLLGASWVLPGCLLEVSMIPIVRSLHKRAFLLAEQVYMYSCSTQRYVSFLYKKTSLVVRREDKSSCTTRRLASFSTRRQILFEKRRCVNLARLVGQEHVPANREKDESSCPCTDHTCSSTNILLGFSCRGHQPFGVPVLLQWQKPTRGSVTKWLSTDHHKIINWHCDSSEICISLIAVYCPGRPKDDLRRRTQ